MGSVVKAVVNYGSESEERSWEHVKTDLMSHLDSFLFPEEFGWPEHHGNTLLLKTYGSGETVEKLIETLRAVSAGGYVQAFLSMPEFAEEMTLEFVDGSRTYERQFSTT